MELLVTTSDSPTTAMLETGHKIATELGALFVPKKRTSLTTLKKQYNVDHIIVVTRNGPVVHTPGGEYFFHLSMAELRIKNLRNGKHDHMITAMKLEKGMSVLDCTLGLATDAIVASFVLGKDGLLVGLEHSPIIAMVARWGLENFDAGDSEINGALRRIQVKQGNYEEYLIALPDNSFDVVYFDPMFRRPVYTSSSLRPLRYLANHNPLTSSAIASACRVAKRRVVMKEAAGSAEFERLGFKTLIGGKHSSIQYGVIDLEPSAGGRPWSD
ncbi:class I SAM-dependent methyltransferase [Sporolituus thermophilus]|uniref:SAM-dependent methyltransferase n=1 Tax=Sporolituus thermophilus DSM 23256 TaxID=1123285 RepID=A0A1G7M268_9FIRM|nr:class I SAM-dependent methyltransferase [Sporolituus thermophilus]SDF55918.1 Putative SAM-dependent methyltransferase [Sporolituus thermophilus DSM 23256]